MTTLHFLLRPATPLVAGLALSGCSIFAPPPPPPPPPPPTVSVARLYEQPAERALISALRFYEEGQYERAEALLKRALADGLQDKHDIAVAQKHLAFIACAYNRPSDCEQAFRAAFVADPAFRLTDAEVGHPLWGPVYQRVASEQTAKLPPTAK
ncbi:MAG TPA: TssQ family T6SS-associated lipoprotein [Burkholderiaceae bacterium]|nr:TssQ family T6SS-associated lipoprotein [Burkholderiaceae bacterium]HQR71145.1 TssQ family T6SS-associated lipoprotein [Burkholderiaceae bacterium]